MAHFIRAAAAFITVLSFSSAALAQDTVLIALYTFDGTLRDASGHGLTAKDTGTPAYLQGAPFGGRAIAFDGTGKAVVTVPLNISVAALKQVTFGAWVLTRTVQTPEYGIISNDDGNYDRTLDIDERTGATKPTWSAFVGGNVVGKMAAIPGKWTFLAVSYDQSASPGTYAFYANDGGQTTVMKGAANFDSDSVTKAVTIGSNPNYDHAFRGAVANAFFYKGILSADQIEQLIAKGPSGIPGYK